MSDCKFWPFEPSDLSEYQAVLREAMLAQLPPIVDDREVPFDPDFVPDFGTPEEAS